MNKSEIIREADLKGSAKLGPKALAEQLNKSHPDMSFTEQFVSTVRSKARKRNESQPAAAAKQVKIQPKPPVKAAETAAVKSVTRESSMRPAVKQVVKSAVKVNPMLQAIEQYKQVQSFVETCGGVSEAHEVLKVYASQAS